MAVHQMPSLNMCGFLYIGTDIGGFSGNCSRELLLRWLAFGVFTPLMRDHTMKGTRHQECYRYWFKKDFRNVVSLRYRLLPYLYSEYMKAAVRGKLYFRPLAFDFPEDSEAAQVEDQLLVGDSIMMTPLLEKRKNMRTVYLPEDMTKVLYDGSFHTSELEKGFHEIHARPGQVVFFIRKDCLVPIAEDAEHVEQVDLKTVTLLGTGTRYEQYLDDGQTQDYSEEHIRVLTK